MSSHPELTTPKNYGKRKRVAPSSDDGSDTEDIPSTASPPPAPKKLKKTIEIEPTEFVEKAPRADKDDNHDQEELDPKQILDAALRTLARRKNRVREDFLISFENLSSEDCEILKDKKVDIGFMGTKPINCDWKQIEFCLKMGIKVTLHSYPGAKVFN